MGTRDGIGINLLADITALHSYAESSRQIANSLLAAHIPFVINDYPSTPHSVLRKAMYRLVFHSRNDTSFGHFVSLVSPHPINLVRLPPDVSRRFYASRPEYFLEKKSVAIWAWNFPEFSAELAACFRPYNEIWAVSRFVRDALVKSSPVPVQTLTPPLAIDLSSLDAAYVRKRFGLNGKSCVFLFTFVSHTGGGFERKNPFAVIEAFRGAFTRGEDAVLVIKTTPPYPLAFAKNLKSYVRGFRNIAG